MKKWLLVFLASYYTSSYAQDKDMKALKSESEKNISKDTNDTIPQIWKKGGLFNLNVAQGSLSNWAGGGEDFSMSLNLRLSLYGFYKKGRHNWDNTFDFYVGYVNTTSLGTRKNDDRFDLLSKYGYVLAPKWNVAATFNARSQIFKGYTYPDNIRTYSSNFLAPGYILLGIGLDWRPTKNLSVFISPATARWVLVNDTALANKGFYGVTPGKKSNLEVGAYVSANYLKQFNKYLAYKGRLDLFSNYKHNPQNVDLYMTNALWVTISKWLSVTYNLDLIYDDDVRMFGKNRNSAALQAKSVVGIGVVLKF